MKRLVLLGCSVALTGCLSFEDGGRYKCDPKAGKDCDYILPSSNVRIENGRFEPVTAEVAGAGYAVVGGTLVGPAGKVCNSQVPSICVEGGVSP